MNSKFSTENRVNKKIFTQLLDLKKYQFIDTFQMSTVLHNFMLPKSMF